jgi:hypothetical protein
VARVWVATMIRGVPVGVQIAWLLCTTSGWPFDMTRVVPVSHCAETQGPLPAVGGGKVQPATTNGAVVRTVGWPLTLTRGFGAVACAWPA